jgi:hypothetical protein
MQYSGFSADCVSRLLSGMFKQNPNHCTDFWAD